MNKLLYLLACTLASITLSAQSAWTLLPEKSSSTVYGIYTLNSDHFVACSEWGRLYLSEDGGTQIDQYQLTDNFSILSDVTFADSQHGFAGGGCYFVTDDCKENVIATTSDGGQSWKWTRIAEGLGAFIKLDAFPDGTVWALSDFGGLYKGNTVLGIWDQQDNPGAFTIGSYTDMQFINPQQGFVTHFQPDANGNYKASLLYTDNAGQDWALVSAGAPDLFGQAPYYFLDTKNGFRLGAKGTLERSVDGGHTWTNTSTFGATENLRQLYFVNSQTGYLNTWEDATQKGRIYRSTDGGDHWTQDLELDSVLVTNFHFSDANNGYAVVNWSQFYKRSGTNAAHETGNNSTLLIQPNPSEGRTQLVLPQVNGLQTLVISDALGREFRRVNLEKGQNTLEIITAGWPAGCYFLSFPGAELGLSKLLVR